jgi:putative oxidoreductase
MARSSKIIPQLAWYTALEPYAFTFIRLATGLAVAGHGYGRIFLGRGTSEVGSYLAGLPAIPLGWFELIGGLAVAAGFLVRPISLLFVVEWIAIAASVQVKPGSSWLMLGATPHYAAFVAALMLAFVVSGPGRLSVDEKLGVPFSGSETDEPSESLGYLIVRLALGLMLLPAGIDKLFLGGVDRIAAGNIKALGLEPAMAWAWLVAVVEFFGAVAFILGLFVRPFAVAVFIELLVIAFGIMALRGYYWTAGGMEVALLMAAASLCLVLGGGGRYALDRVIGREF